MRSRAIALAAAGALTLASSPLAFSRTAPQPSKCTSAVYRAAAKAAYKPWWRPATRRHALRHARRCAPNARTRGQMRRIDANQRAGRREAIGHYRALTPYVGGSGRWAIPWPIVVCESGGSWFAANPSGAVGPYQLLGHGAPYPATTMDAKMENHRIASELYAGGAGRGAWVC